MPIYVYEPTVFSLEEEVSPCCFFEKLQSFSENPLTRCCTCGHAVHRAVTSFHVTPSSSAFSHMSESSPAEKVGLPSTARNAAHLAKRHVCAAGCSH